MRVWVIKDGELLPCQREARPMRTGMLANCLSERGHEVTWWASTFSHQRKSLLWDRDIAVRQTSGLTLQLLFAGSYASNVSVARIVHHRRLARRFSFRAEQGPRPDAIVCAYPPIDLALAVARYAKRHHVPLIVDVRDQWPDTFSTVAPWVVRPFIGIYARWLRRTTREVFCSADSLVAMSRGCLQWAARTAGRSDEQNLRVFYIGCPSVRPLQVRNCEFEAEIRQRALGKTVFLYLGTFGQSYDLGILCDCARELQSLGRDDVLFILAGDGPKHAEIQKRAQPLRNLWLTGWADSDKAAALIAASHVGIVPIHPGSPLALPGSFPNKPFQYLSGGLPILSSVTGEMAELIRDNRIGLLYDAGNLHSLVAAVTRLTSAPDTEDLKTRAMKIFEDQFEEGTIYYRYAEFVEKLAVSGGSSVSLPVLSS